ncbi:uncharacterized protein LOC105180362 [Sesamum indicum]|uniref:Uncharacterized protein LOC105180362 n=1 Tax=Sesamum indicum TaxID=4182 RepID=A0A6I9UNT8_SESIN|nr:uncharacterized protein LOC105180362 [Sesamum indicum]
MKIESIDDSFKKPGAVPFKWEIRPGVPKLHNPQPPSTGNDDHHFEFEFRKPRHQWKRHLQQNQSAVPVSIHNSTFPETPRRLKPPPAGFYFHPPMEARTRSLRSSPRSHSHRFGLPGLARSDVVSSVGCFPTPLAKRKNAKKSVNAVSRSEPEYYSDLDTPMSSRWSVSSRKSVSPLSSSFASYQSSPRPVVDADWAAFGLF